MPLFLLKLFSQIWLLYRLKPHSVISYVICVTASRAMSRGVSLDVSWEAWVEINSLQQLHI